MTSRAHSSSQTMRVNVKGPLSVVVQFIPMSPQFFPVSARRDRCRICSSHQARAAPPGAISCKILFLAANPSCAHLALDEEARDIEAKIRVAEHRDAIELKTRWAVRGDDLLQALNEDRPAVVHFSGHGSGPLGILMHDEAGGQKPVSAAALKRVFTALKNDIRVVLLSACHSKEQGLAIAEVIDCVIGMNNRISDDAARRFSASFYRALGFGRSVQNAFQQGLSAIALEDLADENVPVLLVRDGINADDVHLVRDKKKERRSGRPAKGRR
jgi:hypothetical protein